MSGDFSRLTFDPARHFDAVLMQQGRPQLDADWNEHEAIHSYRRETQTRDLVGLHGAPREHAGFGVQLRAALDFDGRSQMTHVSPSGNLHGADLARFKLELTVSLPHDHQTEGVLAGGERSQWRLQVDSDARVSLHDNTRSILTSQSALVFGAPTRVELSCDSEHLRLSFDGQPAGEAECPMDGHAHTAPASFGGPSGRRAGASHFRGQLEEMRVLDGDNHTLAHWPLVGVNRDELLRDASGNDNDLQLAPAAPRWLARDLLFGRGRMYVEGLTCENEHPLMLSQQTAAPASSVDLGVPRYLAYLDVWKRDVDAISQPDLREVALGGADTAIRAQIVWHARVLAIQDAERDWHDQWRELLDDLSSTGALRAQYQEAAGIDVGNQLYRIEIHRPGKAGEATFKWSRDNASISFSVLSADVSSGLFALADLGRDSYALQTGDWVEYMDEQLELRRTPGLLLRVTSIDRARATVTLVGDGLQQLSPSTLAHARLRRWDQDDNAGELGVPDSPTQWITLENGVQVSFAHGIYRTGDYWLVPTRTALQNVEWPVDLAAGPLFRTAAGVRHHYCPLALVDLDAEGPRVRDERHLFDPLTELREIRSEQREPERERDLRVDGDLTILGDAHVHGHVHVGRLSGELGPDIVDTEQLADGAVTRAKLAADVDLSPLPTGTYILSTSPESGAGYAYDGVSLVADRIRRQRILDVNQPGTVSGVAIGAELYVVSDLGSVWAFDAAKDQLTEVARMDRPRPDMRVVEAGGRLLIIGGLNPTGDPTGAVSELDLANARWQERAPLSVPRRDAALGVIETHVHVVGGLRQGAEPLRRHDVYDVEQDSWSSRADLPTPRRGMVAAGVGGRLLVIGGEARGRQWRGGADPHHTEEFDPRHDRWHDRAPLPRGSVPLAAVGNNDQLVVLAEPLPAQPRRSAPQISERWTFDLDTEWWSQQAPVRRPANTPTLVRAGSTIYLVGSNTSQIVITPVMQTLYVHRRL